MSVRTVPESAAPHFPLAALLWPHRADGSSGLLRSVILVVLGTVLLTLSAKVNLPLPYVPMTLQTLVVLVIGAAYGWRLGSVTLLAYLAVGRSDYRCSQALSAASRRWPVRLPGISLVLSARPLSRDGSPSADGIDR